MATQIGTLTIEMAANISRLVTDMEQAKSTVGAAMKGIEGAVNIAKSAFIGLTGVTSALAFKSMIEDVITAKAELGRMAVQTGASVESLSAIGQMAKYTGTNIADVSSAINKLQKNLAISNEDSKGASTALKALGINFAAFKAMAPDEQMLTVAKAMDKFQDGGGKSAAAMLLFGKAGAQLLPLLQELADKNELVGKTTTESAKESEQFEKNLRQLQLAGDAWKRQLVDDMLPSLLAVTKAMAEARKQGDGLLGSLAAGISTLLTGDDQYKNNVRMVELTDQYLNLTNYMDKLKASGYDDSTKVVQSTRAQIAAVESQIKTVRSYTQVLGEQEKKEADVRKQHDDERTKNGQLKVSVPAKDRESINAGLALLDTLKTKYELLTGHVSEYEQAERKMAAMRKQVAPELRKQIEDQARLNDALTAQKKMDEGYVQDAQARQAAQEAVDQSYADGILAMSKGADDYLFQISLIGKTAEEITRLTAVRAINLQQEQIEAGLSVAVSKGIITQAEYLERLNAVQQTSNDLKEKQADLMREQDAQHTNPLTGIDKATKDYAETVRKAGDAWKDLSTSAIGGFEDRMTDFFSKGKADWKGYFANIYAEVIRLQVVRPMLASIFNPNGGAGTGALKGLSGGAGYVGGNIRGAIGSMGSGGAVGGTYGPDNIDVGGGFSPAGYASGGRPTPGVPSIVGEVGPEIFIPDSAGTVVPNSAMGGTTINFSPVIHIDARTDRAEVYSVVSRAMQENNQRLGEQLRQQGAIA